MRERTPTPMKDHHPLLSDGFWGRGKRNEVNNKPGHRGQGSPGVVGKGEVVHTILVIGAVWHFPASVLQIQVR